jgi:sugar-specific transcriptional regulator TrmB
MRESKYSENLDNDIDYFQSEDENSIKNRRHRSNKRSVESKDLNLRTIYPSNDGNGSENNMENDQLEVPIFESAPDSHMYDYRTAFEKLKNQLTKFGLTSNQAKVYIFLSKYGSKTAPEVCKALKIPRTETYHLLTTLQNKGTVSATFQHPIKFSALPLNKAVWILVNAERERVKDLEKQKEEIVTLWNDIPDFAEEETEKEDKFQMLQGTNQINSKIQEMITNHEKEMLILGSERDFLRLYHSDFLEPLNDSKVNYKFLTACSDKILYIFDEVDRTKVKRMPADVKEHLCFIIKDDAEMLFFLRNANQSSQNVIAMWTDSTALIHSMKLLFESVWSRSKGIHL